MKAKFRPVLDSNLYTSELAGEPHLTQGAILGVDVDELLKNGEVLTLLATEEEDGSLTLVSPPIPNKETGDDAEISVAKESQNAMQCFEELCRNLSLWIYTKCNYLCKFLCSESNTLKLGYMEQL